MNSVLVPEQFSYDHQHRREQAEAAVHEACGLLNKYSENYVLYVRISPGHYARHIAGRTNVERIAIAAGVQADLNVLVSDVAIVAAREVDLDEGNAS